jgi:NAD(P)H-nitrite reductase large subunit
MQHVVIIGNGISGITCARNIRKKTNDQITVISSESQHFYSRTALMYIYMGHMKYEHTKPYEDFFWEKNKIDLLQKKVTDVNDADKNITTEDGQKIKYDTLIIATGSVTAMYNWPGQNLKGVNGLYSLQDLEIIEKQTQHIKTAVIVGGGLIGVELAEMLHTRHIKVTILVKDKYYWGSVLPEEDAELIEHQLAKNGINVLHNTELEEITGDENGNVKSVKIKNSTEIFCEFVGITTGVKPNISFLKNTNIKTAKGVIINEYFETGCKDIYAIGDCAEFENELPGRKKIEQVWYTGRMHGETLAQTITGQRCAYKPGPWFNSAKFFDLEYQTYGNVPSKKEEGYNYFFWENEQKNAAAGIYYRETDKTFTGINSYGIRLRHAFFDKNLKGKKSVEFILSNLAAAIFDPEFAKDYVQQIINEWNKKTGSSVKKKNKLAATFHL